MANAPTKYIDFKDGLAGLLTRGENFAIGNTILPGHGQITPPSAEFMAGKQNPFPNALPLPRQDMTYDSLAGALMQMRDQGFIRPGQEGMDARQRGGFFAQTNKDRLGAQY
jgi:hypothetical protein